MWTRIPVLLGHVKDPRNRDCTVSSSSLAWLCHLGQILLLTGLGLPTCERGIVISTLDSYCVVVQMARWCFPKYGLIPPWLIRWMWSHSRQP